MQTPRIGIIDDQLDPNHPAFGCSPDAQPWTQTNKCGRVVWYANFTNPKPLNAEPTQTARTNATHGTAVASIAAGGRIDNVTIGTAPGAEILFARITNTQGKISLGAALAAAEGLIDPDHDPATHDAPQVITSSWDATGGLNNATIFHQVIHTWRTLGIVPVFAATKAPTREPSPSPPPTPTPSPSDQLTSKT